MPEEYGNSTDTSGVKRMGTLRSLWGIKVLGHVLLRATPFLLVALVFFVIFDLTGTPRPAELPSLGAEPGEEFLTGEDNPYSVQPSPETDVSGLESRELPAAWAAEVEDVNFLTRVGDLLIATSAKGEVVALDPENGSIRWRRSVGSWIAPCLVYAEGKVFFWSRDRTMHALDASAGLPVWETETAGEVAGPLAYDRGVLYFTCDNDRPFGLNSTVYALRASDGNLLWSRHYEGWVTSLSTTGGGGLVISCHSMEVSSLYQSDGRERWTMRTENQVLSPALEAGGVVFLSTIGGDVYALREEKGNLLWKSELNDYVWCPPAMGSGGIVIGSKGMAFYELDPATGKEVWTLNLNDELDLPFQLAEGKVYAFSSQGRIYVISEGDGALSGLYRVEGDFTSTPVVWEGRVFCSGGGLVRAFVLPPAGGP